MYYLNEVCKIGQGADCCRYIASGKDGIVCLKLTDLKETVDKRVKDGLFTATGDNCEGEKE